MNTDGLLAISALSLDLPKLRPIHSGARHKLYRYSRSDTALVIKIDAADPTSASADASVRHEFGLLRDIKLPGIVRVRS